MPRQSRDDGASQSYHALRWGNHQQKFFHKAHDDEAFIRVLAERLEQ